MNKYEGIVIIKENYTEDDIKNFIKKIRHITNVSEIEKWGLKKLAYPIQKNNKGYYISFNFHDNSENIDNIENLINNDETIIKHIIVKMD